MQNFEHAVFEPADAEPGSLYGLLQAQLAQSQDSVSEQFKQYLVELLLLSLDPSARTKQQRRRQVLCLCASLACSARTALKRTACRAAVIPDRLKLSQNVPAVNIVLLFRLERKLGGDDQDDNHNRSLCAAASSFLKSSRLLSVFQSFFNFSVKFSTGAVLKAPAPGFMLVQTALCRHIYRK